MSFCHTQVFLSTHVHELSTQTVFFYIICKLYYIFDNNFWLDFLRSIWDHIPNCIEKRPKGKWHRTAWHKFTELVRPCPSTLYVYICVSNSNNFLYGILFKTWNYIQPFGFIEPIWSFSIRDFAIWVGAHIYPLRFTNKCIENYSERDKMLWNTCIGWVSKYMNKINSIIKRKSVFLSKLTLTCAHNICASLIGFSHHIEQNSMNIGNRKVGQLSIWLTFCQVLSTFAIWPEHFLWMRCFKKYMNKIKLRPQCYCFHSEMHCINTFTLVLKNKITKFLNFIDADNTCHLKYWISIVHIFKRYHCLSGCSESMPLKLMWLKCANCGRIL